MSCLNFQGWPALRTLMRLTMLASRTDILLERRYLVNEDEIMRLQHYADIVVFSLLLHTCLALGRGRTTSREVPRYLVEILIGKPISFTA
jgi:hypothetical protein